jgi:hypothetical protein
VVAQVHKIRPQDLLEVRAAEVWPYQVLEERVRQTRGLTVRQRQWLTMAVAVVALVAQELARQAQLGVLEALAYLVPLQAAA